MVFLNSNIYIIYIRILIFYLFNFFKELLLINISIFNGYIQGEFMVKSVFKVIINFFKVISNNKFFFFLLILIIFLLIFAKLYFYETMVNYFMNYGGGLVLENIKNTTSSLPQELNPIDFLSQEEVIDKDKVFKGIKFKKNEYKKVVVCYVISLVTFFVVECWILFYQ